MGRFYLGVDGGQSSTTALICNEDGLVLGRGSAGPCNHVPGAKGRAKFSHAVGDSLQQARGEAGLDAAVSFAAACLGFSGGAADKEAYSRDLVPAARYKVTHDAEIALTGATCGTPGIIMIAGTGSMAFGRNHNGQTARAGGWGYVFGDEGGGFDLARRGLRAALQQEEGWGPITVLGARLQRETGATSMNDLVHDFYAATLSRSRFAGLARIVTEAAEEGDAVARQIVLDAASTLCVYVAGVHAHLFPSGDRVPIAPIGGAFRSTLLLTGFTAEVKSRLPCDVIQPALSPAAGALLEALRLDQNFSSLSNVPESEK